MVKLKKDLSMLTNIPVALLSQIEGLGQDLIAHSALESSHEKLDVCEIDLGIGILSVRLTDLSNIKCRFVLSEETTNAIKAAITNKESPLIYRAEQELASKIEQAYKELL